MIHASDSIVELPVLLLKTRISQFLKTSSVDPGFEHKFWKTIDCP